MFYINLLYKMGLNFLDRLFRHHMTHEAGLSLLTNVLQDPRFMKEAQVFGTDLISFTLRQQAVYEDFQKLVVRTLQEPDCCVLEAHVRRRRAAEPEADLLPVA